MLFLMFIRNTLCSGNFQKHDPLNLTWLAIISYWEKHEYEPPLLRGRIVHHLDFDSMANNFNGGILLAEEAGKSFCDANAMVSLHKT